MGTMIQSHGLTEADLCGERYAGHASELKGNSDILCLTRSDLIADIHHAYLEAGADIISTNTFNATAIVQADYCTEDDLHDLVHDLNLAAARLARAAADEYTALDVSRPRFVAGVLGPTSRSCWISPGADHPDCRNVTFDQMAAAYREQVIGLLDGGVDILMVESVTNTLSAKAALSAIRELLEERGLDLPVWVSAAVSDSGGGMFVGGRELTGRAHDAGRGLTGQTIEAFWISISHAKPFCVGLNCGPGCDLGREALQSSLVELSRAADVRISLHPNARLDEAGEYRETPAEMAGRLKELAEQGLVNIVGGCCGTTPEHTAAIAREVSELAPRRVSSRFPHCRLSGRESLEIRPDSPFLKIGERTNVTGSARFARLIREGRHADAVAVARQQIGSGAQIIDVNLDDALLDSVAEMTAFLNLIAGDPEVSRVPVMIDSAAWEVIEAGLKCLPGRGIVNSISLQGGEEEFVCRARLVRRYGAAVVAMAIDRQGPAEDRARKVEICTRAYRILSDRVGFPPQEIILDPAIFAVGTGLPEHSDFAVAYIEACRLIKETLPHCWVSGGISNLSFAYRGNDTVRAAMHAVFLHHAIPAGMDMGIVNPGQLMAYEELPDELRDTAEDVILNRRPDAAQRLAKLARRTRSAAGSRTKREGSGDTQRVGGDSGPAKEGEPR
jgi:5-methyltetrahydrofolate--homocysteine methyltransferase